MTMESGHQFDREKMRAVILRAIHTCEASEVGAVKLHKILYFLDMISYAANGAAVVGATYRKRPFGPTADQLLSMLREMEKAREIEIATVDFHGYFKKEYHAKVAESNGVLNDAEISLLDDVIEMVCKNSSAKEISDYSHQLPWELAEFGEIIPYHTAMLLFPSHPSPEAFEAVKQGADDFEVEGHQNGSVVLPLLSDFRSRVLLAA